MDAPICRICSQRHWGAEHIWPGATRKAEATVEKADYNVAGIDVAVSPRKGRPDSGKASGTVSKAKGKPLKRGAKRKPSRTRRPKSSPAA